MIHQGRFDAKVAVVTGAAQGIGHTVAGNLAREGGKVALVDRSELIHEVREKLVDELRAKLPDGGAEILALTGDLERYADCCAVMSRAREHFGRIDILINNVGGTIWAKPYEYYEESQIEAEIRRSLFPTLWCCRAVLPCMLEQGRGTIVNVSSIATRSVNRVPYAAAKGGVNALTASLAFEYAGQGIRVVAAAPGGTEAPERRNPRGPGAQTDEEKAWYRQIVDQTVESTYLKRYATLDEQAAPILFLASDEASYVVGSTLPVGGGDLG
jgi:dihydroxycyclohexadiene carboxylate dehydrogenase